MWWARRSVDSVRESKTTGFTSRKDAEAVVRRWNSEAADPAFAVATTVTLEDACTRFLASSRRRVVQGGLAEASVKIHAEKVSALLRGLGAGTLLSRITPALVMDYVDARTDTSVCRVHARGGKGEPCDPRRACGDALTSHTVAKELCVLRGVLGLARHRQEWPHDPESVMPPNWSTGYVPRKRFLTPEEWKALRDSFPKERQAHLAFILATGARKGEAERARKCDVDLKAGLVLIRGTKTTASADHVPVVPWARPLLEFVIRVAEDLDLQADALLFAPWASMQRDLREHARKLGMAHVSPNDLRRTGASWMIQDGVAHALVARWLRHTTIAMVQAVYGRQTDTAAQRLLAEHYDGRGGRATGAGL